MKKTTIIFSLVLGLLSLALLAGCGGSPDDNPDAGKPAGATGSDTAAMPSGSVKTGPGAVSADQSNNTMSGSLAPAKKGK